VKALRDMDVDELADLIEKIPRGGELELETGRAVKRQEWADPDGWEYRIEGGLSGLSAHEAAHRLLDRGAID
jgi:hypothetical protein